jgi:hypothetical protein
MFLETMLISFDAKFFLQADLHSKHSSLPGFAVLLLVPKVAKLWFCSRMWGGNFDGVTTNPPSFFGHPSSTITFGIEEGSFRAHESRASF